MDGFPPLHVKVRQMKSQTAAGHVSDGYIAAPPRSASAPWLSPKKFIFISGAKFIRDLGDSKRGEGGEREEVCAGRQNENKNRTTRKNRKEKEDGRLCV